MGEINKISFADIMRKCFKMGLFKSKYLTKLCHRYIFMLMLILQNAQIVRFLEKGEKNSHTKVIFLAIAISLARIVIY